MESELLYGRYKIEVMSVEEFKVLLEQPENLLR